MSATVCIWMYLQRWMYQEAILMQCHQYADFEFVKGSWQG